MRSIYTNYRYKSWRWMLQTIMAGICISLGCIVNLKVGGVTGAVLFSFGFVSVIHYSLPLYTDLAGDINYRNFKDIFLLIAIYIGNVLGCDLAMFLMSNVDATPLIQARIDSGYLACFARAIGCGIIMKLIVQGGREGNFWMVPFGIAVFILAGFYHSIADAFYLFTVNNDLIEKFIPYYGLIVAGNYVGCRIPKVLQSENKF